MELIEGEIMEKRWCEMSESERVSVCLELWPMVEAWWELKQDPCQLFAGKFVALAWV